MRKEDNPSPSIQQQVFDLDFDLKAETFTAHLLESDVAFDIHLSDYFKRRFSKDITRIGEGNVEGEKLDVHLSRRSFYNIFPERFFHTAYSSTPFVDIMVADYKNRKLEEEQARKFFKPLETEFFLQRVAIEKDEAKTFESLGNANLVDFLTDLWNIDSDIPDKMAAKIVKTMPLMYKIAGNLPLLKRILENIIEERVSIKKGFVTIGYQTDNAPWQLGVNMATVLKPMTFLPKYTFTIIDIKRPEAIEDYLPEGKIISVIAFFLEHTLPFESDFEIDFTMADPKTKFVLSETVYEGRLGISATI